MDVTSFLTRVNNLLRGTDDDAPTFGSDEANLWLDILNSILTDVYDDVSKEWRFSFKTTAPNEPGTVATAGTTTLTGTDTYFTDYKIGDKITVSGETERTIATITSDTSLTVTSAFSNTASDKTFTRSIIIDEDYESYNMHRRLISLSDEVCIEKTDGTKTYYRYIRPQERSTNREVYLSDENPEILTFTTDILSTEDIVGGTLVVPGFYGFEPLTAATDLIPVSSPNWACRAVAAAVAFSDITYEDKTADLNNQANDLYMKMVKKNRRGTYDNPNRVPTNVYRIKGTNYRRR